MRLKFLIPSLVLFILLLGIQMPVSAVLINDNYWGADPTNGYPDKDVIGNPDWFDITKMEVNFGNPGGMVVDIYTTYLDNIGMYGTQLGDLFISTNGWNPNGPAPYTEDNMNSGGESWEYVLVMDDHIPTGVSGTAELYAMDESRIIQSWCPQGYIHRAGQEVQYDTDGLFPPIATGSWAIENLGGDDNDDYLRFIIDYDFNDVTGYGFHYALSCGNDVIEGSAPVPEPATMFLLGSSLIVVAGFGRKKLLKKRK